MNKLLLLPRIKSLIFVLKFSTEYDIDFIYNKKVSEQSFCSRFKIYVLMNSMFVFAFLIIRPIIFSAIEKENFPQSRSFSTIKEIFHSKRIFPKSRKFSTIKKFSTVKGLFCNQKIFCKQRSKRFSKS